MQRTSCSEILNYFRKWKAIKIQPKTFALIFNAEKYTLNGHAPHMKLFIHLRIVKIKHLFFLELLKVSKFVFI